MWCVAVSVSVCVRACVCVCVCACTWFILCCSRGYCVYEAADWLVSLGFPFSERRKQTAETGDRRTSRIPGHQVETLLWRIARTNVKTRVHVNNEGVSFLFFPFFCFSLFSDPGIQAGPPSRQIFRWHFPLFLETTQCVCYVEFLMEKSRKKVDFSLSLLRNGENKKNFWIQFLREKSASRIEIRGKNSKRFLRPKEFWDQKSSETKRVRPKEFWDQNSSETKRVLRPKEFWDQKSFETKRVLRPKEFWDQKSFETKRVLRAGIEKTCHKSERKRLATSWKERWKKSRIEI